MRWVVCALSVAITVSFAVVNHAFTSAGHCGGVGMMIALMSGSAISQSMASQVGEGREGLVSILLIVVLGAVWSEPVGGRLLSHCGCSKRRAWFAKARSRTEGLWP